MNILAIALNTYREAIRNKVFYIIFLFAIVMILFSLFLAMISLGEQDRILKHVGLSTIEIFGLLLAMFVGVNLVYDEMERRTIYTIISSGVRRYQFIIGKFVGLFITVLATIIFMSIVFFLLLVLTPGTHFTPALLFSIYNSLLSMAVIIAVAVLFSSFSTPVLSAVLTFLVYVIGNLSNDVLEFAKRLLEEGHVVLPRIAKIVHFFIPHLDWLNIKNYVLAEKAFTVGPWETVYTLGYCTVLLFITSWIFSRRDLK